MLAIALPVRDVIEKVNRRRHQAEDGECGNRPGDRDAVEETLAEEQSGEDDEILGPLARAQGNEQGKQARPRGHPVTAWRVGARRRGAAGATIGRPWYQCRADVTSEKG